MTKKLTTRRRRFTEEFLVDCNATQAAIRAGFSEKTARQQASRLLSDVDVQAEVACLAKARSDRVQFTADDVLRESANLAMTSMAAFVDEDGYIVANMKELPEEAVKCVQEVVQETLTTPDGGQVARIKLKLYDRLKALTVAGKHVGVRAFVDEGPQGQQRAGWVQRMSEIRQKMDEEERQARERGACVKCERPLRERPLNGSRRKSPAREQPKALSPAASRLR